MIRRHPLTAFLALTFILTWGLAGVAWVLQATDVLTIEPASETSGAGRPLGGLPAGASSDNGAEGESSEVSLPWWGYLVLYPALWGPTLSALIVASRLGEIRPLLSKLLRWRVPIVWWLVALLLLPALEAVAVFVAQFYTSIDPSAWRPDSLLSALTFFATGVVAGPLGEELGWRGFALPRLLRRTTPLRASLFIGVIWAAWHLPAFYVPGVDRLVLPPGFGFLPFSLMIVAIAVILTWLTLHARGSILLAVIMHTSIYAALLGLGQDPSEPLIWTGVGVVTVAAAIIVWLDPTLGADRARAEDLATDREASAAPSASEAGSRDRGRGRRDT